MKNRVLAVILALFLGGLGVHRFYLRRYWSGLLYLFFFWTYIPALLGIVDAFRYVFMGEAKFQARYGVAAPPACPCHA